jgi:hypothetical protein
MEAIKAHPTLGTTTIALAQKESGELFLTASQFSNSKLFWGTSLRMEDVHAITAINQPGGVTQFRAHGQSFASMAEAEESLIGKILPGRTKAAASNMWADAAGYAAQEMSLAEQGTAALSQMKGASYKGILMGGALLAGAAIVFGGWKAFQSLTDGSPDSSSGQPGTPNFHRTPVQASQEGHTIDRTAQQQVGGYTTLEINDADLDMAGVDQAFTRHLKSGFARTS